MKAVAAAAETLANAYEAKGPEVHFPETKPAEFEVTATIRDLMQTGSEFTVPQIRDVLISRGWKTEDYKNPLAFIHTVLKRRIKAGEVEAGKTPDGGKFYFDVRGRAEMEEKQREYRTMRREANRAQGIVFAEFKRRIDGPCRTILAANPKGITAKAVCRELTNAGVEMPSHWSNPVMGIKQVLRGLAGVECFPAIRNDVRQNFWRLKPKT
jgi:hypothetical protein